MGTAGALRRSVAPYFGTVFVLLHVAAALGRGGVALQDPGIGWHLATGRLVLATGAVPRADPFSFTAAGRPWMSYYWLADVGSALLERLGGLPAVAAAWMLVYALVPFVVYRTAVRAGANPLAAIPAVLVAQLVLLSHATARPHAATYLFFALLVQCVTDLERGRPTKLPWAFPIVAALWANVHGGFLAGLAAVGAAAAAVGLRWAFRRDPADARRFAVFGALFAAMAVATLLTPYGWRLPFYATEHLQRPSTGYIEEFRSPDFGQGGAAVRAFEVLVLALLGTAASATASLTLIEVVLALGTLHVGLHAARHMNLFAIVAAPLIARGLTAVLAAWAPHVHARWMAIAREQEATRAWRLQLPAIATLVMAVTFAGLSPFPTTLDGLQLTAGAAQYIAAHPERFARAFNTDALGGSLIYRFWPRLRVFVDDRTNVYDESFLMQDYFTVLYGRAGWEEVLDRWNVTSAIMARTTECARLLESSPKWRVEYADDRNVIVSRAGGGT